MDFVDFTWDEVEGTFVKENILGSEFSFSTKTNMEVSIDYIPKIQARKIFTYAKEQLDILKNGNIPSVAVVEEVMPPVLEQETETIEEMETEEVTSFAEIMPAVPDYTAPLNTVTEATENENNSAALSQDELFAKLQNYKKLLDNGLILQGEYDAFKKEILSQM